MTNETGGGGVHRLGHQFIHQEVGLIGYENGFFRNDRIGEILLQVFRIFFNRNNVLLQEPGQVLGELLIDFAQRRPWSLRYRKNTIHGFHTGFGISRFIRHTADLC